MAKIAVCHPLNDADRALWLAQMAAWRSGESGGVIARSALKRAYRRRLAEPGLQIVYLEETFDVVRGRLEQRLGHFIPTTLVDSQFEALEPPTADEGS